VHAAERGGFEIIDALAGADEAAIVDCLDLPSAVPGRVRILAPADVAGSARLTGGHDIAVNVALDLARLLGIEMPERVVIVGIEGADTTLLRDGLTPEVAAAAARVAERLHLGLRIGFRKALDCFVERPCASVCGP
jgi:hydrogenase maturation protease